MTSTAFNPKTVTRPELDAFIASHGMDAVVKAVTHLVCYAAKRVWNPQCSEHSAIDLEDLEAEGLLILLDFIETWDESRSSFESYINSFLPLRLYDSLRTASYVPRLAIRQMQSLSTAVEALRKELSREPTAEDIAAKLGCSSDAVLLRLSEMHSAQHLHLLTNNPNTGNQTKRDGQFASVWANIADRRQQSPDPLMAFEEVRTILKGVPDGWRGRHAVFSYCFLGVTMKETAACYGLSESRISQALSFLMEETIRIRLNKLNQIRQISEIRALVNVFPTYCQRLWQQLEESARVEIVAEFSLAPTGDLNSAQLRRKYGTRVVRMELPTGVHVKHMSATITGSGLLALSLSVK